MVDLLNFAILEGLVEDLVLFLPVILGAQQVRAAEPGDRRAGVRGRRAAASRQAYVRSSRRSLVVQPGQTAVQLACRPGPDDVVAVPSTYYA